MSSDEIRSLISNAEEELMRYQDLKTKIANLITEMETANASIGNAADSLMKGLSFGGKPADEFKTQDLVYDLIKDISQLNDVLSTIENGITNANMNIAALKRDLNAAIKKEEKANKTAKEKEAKKGK